MIRLVSDGGSLEGSLGIVGWRRSWREAAAWNLKASELVVRRVWWLRRMLVDGGDLSCPCCSCCWVSGVEGRGEVIPGDIVGLVVTVISRLLVYGSSIL